MKLELKFIPFVNYMHLSSGIKQNNASQKDNTEILKRM